MHVGNRDRKRAGVDVSNNGLIILKRLFISVLCTSSSL